MKKIVFGLFLLLVASSYAVPSFVNSKRAEEKGYKIEKRQFPDNDQKVMNRLGMDKSTEIIIRQLRSEGFENARISEDKQTGRLVIKVPEEVERGRNIFKYIKEKSKFN